MELTWRTAWFESKASLKEALGIRLFAVGSTQITGAVQLPGEAGTVRVGGSPLIRGTDGADARPGRRR